MGIKRSRFQKGLELIPEDLTAEDLSREGEIAYDSDSDKLKYRNASDTKEVVNTDEAQSLENKTIDGTTATGNNTVTTDADQVSYDDTNNGLYTFGDDVQAALDAVKTQLDAQNEASEIDYDNSTSGLTATNVNDAIDEVEGRLDTVEGADYVNSFNTRTGDVVPQASDYDADQVDYDNSTSGLTATDVQAAIDEVEGRVDTAESNISTNSTNISNNDTAISDHINDANDAHDASAISYDNSSSGLTATDVQAAVDEVEGRVDTVESHVAASSDVHGVGVGNSVVGTGTSQVLTNKDIDGGTASNTSRLTVPKETKANLDALIRKEATVVYSTDQSKLFVDNGTDLIPVGSGEGTGSYNYIENGNAELNTDGWTVYANTTAGSRPDDFGGTPAGVTFTRSETNPLVGDASFVLSKDAADRQGSGAYYEFDPEKGHETLKSLLRMIADTTDANIADGDLGIFLVMSDDDFVSDFALVEPNNPDISAGLPQILKQLQFIGGKTKARFCIHIRSTNATAYSAKFDDIILGPHEVAVGTLITNSKKYTPIFTSFGTVTNDEIYYSKVGDKLKLWGTFQHGTLVASEARLSLPNNLSISSKITTTTNIGTYARGANSNLNGGIILAESGNNYINFSAVSVWSDTSVNPLTKANGNDISGGSGTVVSFECEVPIEGWSTNTVSSEDFGGRDIRVRGKGNGGESLTGLSSPVPFTEVEDTTGSWDGTSFTAPESKSYIVTGHIRYNANNTNPSVFAYVDGVQDIKLHSIVASISVTPFTGTIYLQKGQVLTIRQSETTNLINDNEDHWIHIEGLSSPQTLLETEIIAARYNTDSGQAMINNTNTTVIYDNKVQDTHNAVSGGIFTAPVSGFYAFDFQVRIIGMSADVGRVNRSVFINGSSDLTSRYNAVSTGADNSFPLSGVEYLSKGDTLELRINQNNGANRNLISDDRYNTMAIYKIK